MQKTDPEPKRPISAPERRAAHEAAVLVAPRFDLDPGDVFSEKRTSAIVEARRVGFLVLSSVSRWNAERIASVTGFGRSTVDQSLRAIATRQRKSKRLREIVAECLKEAAGGT